jgi:hypothetical protein
MPAAKHCTAPATQQVRVDLQLVLALAVKLVANHRLQICARCTCDIQASWLPSFSFDSEGFFSIFGKILNIK